MEFRVAEEERKVRISLMHLFVEMHISYHFLQTAQDGCKADHNRFPKERSVEDQFERSQEGTSKTAPG